MATKFIASPNIFNADLLDLRPAVTFLTSQRDQPGSIDRRYDKEKTGIRLLVRHDKDEEFRVQALACRLAFKTQAKA
jgi:hypothetical protein